MVLAENNMHRVKYQLHPPLKQRTSLLYSEQMLLALLLLTTSYLLQEFQYWEASRAPGIIIILFKIQF